MKRIVAAVAFAILCSSSLAFAQSNEAPAGGTPSAEPGGTEGQAGRRNEREAIESGEAIRVPRGDGIEVDAPGSAPVVRVRASNVGFARSSWSRRFTRRPERCARRAQGCQQGVQPHDRHDGLALAVLGSQDDADGDLCILRERGRLPAEKDTCNVDLRACDHGSDHAAGNDCHAMAFIACAPTRRFSIS